MRDIENDPDMSHVTCYKLQFLWANPMAEDELRPWMNSDKIDGTHLSRNPADWAVDILEAKPEYRDNIYIIKNSNPRAFAMIEDKIPDLIRTCGQLARSRILANPAAIGAIKKYEIHKSGLPDEILANPSDQIPELLDNALPDLSYFNTYYLMSNSAPWAIELIKKYGVCMDCDSVYKNPHPFVCSYILTHIDYMWESYPFWHCLINKNPGFINYLRENPNKISEYIWCNPAIFEPVRQPGVVPILTELTWSE